MWERYDSSLYSIIWFNYNKGKVLDYTAEEVGETSFL